MVWINDFITRLQTQIEAISSAPSAVYIVAPDNDDYRGSAKTWWVNLSPAGDEETAEPGAKYVASWTVAVTVWVDVKDKQSGAVSTLSSKVEAVRDKLRYNNLSGWLRRKLVADRFGGGEYFSGGESDSVYGYSFTVTGEKQI